MIRDITIGQYYPADSVLHKMEGNRDASYDHSGI